MALKIEKILCPIDLNNECSGALNFPLSLARHFNAKITFCFVAPTVAATAESHHNRLNKLIEDTLDYYVSLIDKSIVDWETVVIEAGDAAEGITAEAAQRGVSLISMCSRYNPVMHTLLGSVSEKVCRTAPCPVLVSHPHELEGDGVKLNRILIAHDFSDHSELALQHSLVLAEKFQAEIHLFNVITKQVRHEPELAWSQSSTSGLYHQTLERLKTAVPQGTSFLPVVKTVVQWGKPYREILAYAAENQIDLIAMGAHGADFGLSTLFGSNVDRVIRQARCPVLVARPLKPKIAIPIVESKISKNDNIIIVENPA